MNFIFKSVLFIGLSLIVFQSKAITGDSTKILTLKDTIFLSVNANDEKIFTHIVSKKQTLFSIARFYGLNVEEIYAYNPELNINEVGPGYKLIIPLPNRAIRRFKGQDFKAWKYINIIYTTQKGDNLFKIAKNHFHMPVDSLMQRNKLTSQVLSEGMKLHVGWISIDGIPDSLRLTKGMTVPLKKSAELSKDFGKVQKKVAKNTRGVAYWQKNGKKNSDLYCLHRTALLNSVVAITNPMKNRTVYAKVIGRIPSKAYSDDVMIIVSPTVAKTLGAIDERFYVKIKYY